jgi:hypothetical protein
MVDMRLIGVQMVFIGLVVGLFVMELVRATRTYNIFASIRMVKEYCYMRIRHFFSHTFESGCVNKRSADGVTEVIYFEGDEKYIIVFPIKKGIRSIKSITPKSIYPYKEHQRSPENDAIMSNIKFCMGPFGNFHGIPTTPKMLGFDQPLVVEYKNRTVEVQQNDIIQING